MEDVIDEFVEEINEEEMLEREQLEEVAEVEVQRSTKGRRRKKNKTDSNSVEKEKIANKRKRSVKIDEDVITEKIIASTAAKAEGSPKKKRTEVEEESTTELLKKGARKGKNKKGKNVKEKVTQDTSLTVPDTAPTVEKLQTDSANCEEEDISKIEEFIKSQNNAENGKTETRGRKRKVNEAKEDSDIQNAEHNVDVQESEVVPEKSKRGRQRKSLNLSTDSPKGVADNAPEVVVVLSQENQPENVELPQENQAEVVELPESNLTEVAGQNDTVINGKRSHKKKGRKKANNVQQNNTDAPGDETQRSESTAAPVPSNTFKPISDWKKVLKFPPNYSELSTKLIDQQIFKNALPPYAPCVPRNTSQRLIDNLTEKELEQLCCPGCKDRFLIPAAFFQHLYRKSVRISFTCRPCGNQTFYNRCHLRTHILSHLEVDGTNSMTMADTDSLSISPLDQSEFDVGFVDETYAEELNTLHREHFRSEQSSNIQCTECRLTIRRDHLSSNFHDTSKTSSNILECSECKMNLPNRCSLEAHERIHRKQSPYVCPGK